LIAAVLETLLEPLAGARDRALATEGDALSTFVRDAVRIQSEHGASSTRSVASRSAR
jgi:hypothetical protein